MIIHIACNNQSTSKYTLRVLVMLMVLSLLISLETFAGDGEGEIRAINCDIFDGSNVISLANRRPARNASSPALAHLNLDAQDLGNPVANVLEFPGQITYGRPVPTINANVPELLRAVVAPTVEFTFEDFVEWAKRSNGYQGVARSLATEHSDRIFGVRRNDFYGIVIDKTQLEQLLDNGILTLPPEQDFKLLTRRGQNLESVTDLIGTDKAYLVLSFNFTQGPRGRDLKFRALRNGQLQEGEINSMSRVLQEMPAGDERWKTYGWFQTVQQTQVLPWHVDSIVVPRNNQVLKDRVFRSPWARSRISPNELLFLGRSLPQMHQMEWVDIVSPLEVISMSDPFHDDQITNAFVSYVFSSEELVDWVHFIGSYFWVTLNGAYPASNDNQSSVQLLNVRFDKSLGDFVLSFLDDNGHYFEMAKKQIRDFALDQYVPNRAKVFTAALTQAQLQLASVRQFINKRETHLQRRIRVLPPADLGRVDN